MLSDGYEHQRTHRFGAGAAGSCYISNSRRVVLDQPVAPFPELACIRWFPAHVLYLTFFTNTILLASFLGMSLGCLAARRAQNFILDTPVLLMVAMAARLRRK